MTIGQVCLTNLDATGRRRRLVLGFAVLSATLAAHFFFVRDRNWILVEVPAFFFGWLCIVQAIERTCVRRAAEGTEEIEGGLRRIAEPAIAAALRLKARWIFATAALAAAATIAAICFVGAK